MALWHSADGAIASASGSGERSLKPKLVRWGLGVITHPFLVLRHQSQLHILYHSWPSPVAPFADVQSLYSMWSTQGIPGLWRGSTSLLASTVCFELVQGGLVSLYEHSRKNKERKMSSNVVFGLRLLSYGIATPFMTGILVSTVQYAMQKIYSGGLSTIPELALERPLWRGQGMIFSTLSLVLPTIFLCFVRSVISSIAQDIVYKILQQRRKNLNASDRAELLTVDIDNLCASVAGSCLADVVTYPLETALVRAHVQGFPVLLDDVEYGQGPVLLPLSYRGWYDMMFTVRTMEGKWGFYKGFSAMVLQYLVQGFILLGLHRWSTKSVG